jgi:cytosine deaminase
MLKIRRARVPVALLPTSLAVSKVDPLEPAMLCDLEVSEREIVSVRPARPAASVIEPGTFDAGGSLVFPGFVDAHVHLDKAHTWHRAPNRTATFGDALATLAKDKDNWTAADLQRRAGFSLKCAWAQGTRVMRTHVDTGLPWAATSHAVMAELREQWRGRIDLQTVPLCGGDVYSTPDGEGIANLAMDHGAVALGGFLVMTPELPAYLDRIMALARERKLALDFHVDENGNAESECLRLVAEAVLRNRFPHPVVCGHCCSLALQPPDRQQSTIALVKEAGLGVISLPLCNLYLQDRRSAGTEFPRSPRWRGLTLVNDLLDAGIPLACASDNVRDAFYPYGDFDPAEVYVQSVRLAHLDSRLADSVRVVTSTAADLVARPKYGRVAPGAPAHLVVFAAHRWSELLSRGGASRRCIDGETIHTPALPDFAELAEPGR